jgi:hypothetical protein
VDAREREIGHAALVAAVNRRRGLCTLRTMDLLSRGTDRQHDHVLSDGDRVEAQIEVWRKQEVFEGRVRVSFNMMDMNRIASPTVPEFNVTLPRSPKMRESLFSIGKNTTTYESLEPMPKEQQERHQAEEYLCSRFNL